MRIIFFFFAALTALPFVVSNGFAVTPSRSSVVLKKLSDTVAVMGEFQGHFTMYWGDVEADGMFMVSGSKYRMEVKDTDTEVLSDGKLTYEINHSNREVVIDSVNPNDNNILTSPLKLFLFPDEMFIHSYIMERSEDGHKYDVIGLRPKEGFNTNVGITLTVDRQSGLPVEVKYAAQGHEELKVVVESIKSIRLSPELFEFDAAAYPSYEIVDFR